VTYLSRFERAWLHEEESTTDDDANYALHLGL
jgi:hypothetical protein